MTREEAIINLKLSQNRIGGIKKEEWNALQMAIEALQDRPKGEWKCMADCGVTECDQCGWNVEEYVGDYNYCPNCGAKMKAR